MARYGVHRKMITYTPLDVQRLTKVAVDEYKERVKTAVNRATCDLMTDAAIDIMAKRMVTQGRTAELLNLILVLNGELHQLKQAVLDQK